jgi:hypothetical protein
VLSSTITGLTGGLGVNVNNVLPDLYNEEQLTTLFYRSKIPIGKKTSLKGRFATDAVTGYVNQIINQCKTGYHTDVDSHLMGLTDGNCGFFAYGVACNNPMLGNRAEWM